MSVLEDYFRRKPSVPSEHPVLRLVDSLTAGAAGSRVALEIVREEDVLGSKPAMCVLHCFDANGTDLQRQEFEWNDDLNLGLIRRKMRAISPENESVRFALSLRLALRVPEIQYGDGYFNAVLVDYVRNSPFAGHPTISSVVQHVHASAVDASSRSYSECTELIDAAIRGRALELSEDLGYPIPEAEEVLAAAVAQYLDERFSVSSRRVLGFL